MSKHALMIYIFQLTMIMLFAEGHHKYNFDKKKKNLILDVGT